MAVPVELRYTAQHEWVLITGMVARIGITDYAQDALGDVVFVGVPTLGGKVVADGPRDQMLAAKSAPTPKNNQASASGLTNSAALPLLPNKACA